MNRCTLFKTAFALAVVSMALFGSPAAFSQQTTERYIPIGQSPGISGKYSFIGEIVSVDPDAHTIVIASNRGRKTVLVTIDTQIWLDRSGAKHSNTVGSYDDCEVGRRVEVMHVRDDEGVAAWIKIESG